MSLARQATVELEIKRREAVYRDVLTNHQTVRTLRAVEASVIQLPPVDGRRREAGANHSSRHM